MCGIGGIYYRQAEQVVDTSFLDRINTVQSHRGPDDFSTFVGAGIGLAHRRLSIIDVAGGHQPMFNEDGSVVIVFNGQIYNFQDLTTELQALGHTFRTRCDTETLVHAWEQWGEDCVSHLRGMFAFAIWDSRQETLFLARDHLGIKPLHYATLADGSLIFGSELKAIMSHPGVSREIDPTALEEYLAFGYVPDPKSIYRHVAKLPAGHTLCLRRGQPQPEPREYWDVRFSETAGTDEAALSAEVRDRLRASVRLQLVSDVPLGAFLSGGVDSSAIVALMAGEMPSAVKTCTIASDSPEFDESRFAAEVAGRYKTQHMTETVAATTDLVDRLIDLYDEPFADSSAIPTFHVCALARKTVTVALSGDGGDEVFAGYRRYRFHAYEEATRKAVPAAFRKPVFGTLGALYPKLDRAPRFLRAKTTFQSIARDSAEGYAQSVSTIQDSLRLSLYSPKMLAHLGGYRAVEVLRQHLNRAPTDDPLGMAQYLDIKTWLPGRMLTKVDRASMANSLEVRVPFLDHTLVEWAATLPRQLKVNGGGGKAILKKALEPLVPHDVLYRPKMGFSIPVTEWFRGPLAARIQGVVTSPALAETGLFNMPALRGLADRHQAGSHDHGAVLWSLLMLESFLRREQGMPQT